MDQLQSNLRLLLILYHDPLCTITMLFLTQNSQYFPSWTVYNTNNIKMQVWSMCSSPTVLRNHYPSSHFNFNSTRPASVILEPLSYGHTDLLEYCRVAFPSASDPSQKFDAQIFTKYLHTSLSPAPPPVTPLNNNCNIGIFKSKRHKLLTELTNGKYMSKKHLKALLLRDNTHQNDWSIFRICNRPYHRTSFHGARTCCHGWFHYEWRGSESRRAANYIPVLGVSWLPERRGSSAFCDWWEFNNFKQT